MRSSEERQDRAVSYFGRSGFRRPLEETWRKIRSLGRVGGEAVIKKATEAECEEINAFFGWNCHVGDTIRIPLVLFESELQDSVFSLDLPSLYELLNGEPLVSNKERNKEQSDEWQRWVADIREEGRGEWGAEVLRWLGDMEQGIGSGSRTLRDCYKVNKGEAGRQLIIVARTLQALCVDRSESLDGISMRLPVRLPVLAARMAGDAHALDSDTIAGRLLIAYMRRERGTGEADPMDLTEEGFEELDTGSQTLKLRDLYRSYGILDDDLSSLVHFYVPERGKPVLPVVWTMRQTEAEPCLPRCSSIFVVENPAIFSSILDALIASPFEQVQQSAALICTSGPASAAAIRWIQRSIEASEHCRLFYSGDFDVKGLVMGHTLYRLFPSFYTPWRFNASTYEDIADKVRVGPPFDDGEKSRLERMLVPWDEELTRSMQRLDWRIHQESFVSDLIDDYLQHVFG